MSALIKLIRRFSFKHTFNDNAVNGRIIKTHRYQHPAFIAVTVFLRYPDNVAHIRLSARARDIPVPALFPKKPRMLLAEPDESRYHLLLID